MDQLSPGCGVTIDPVQRVLDVIKFKQIQDESWRMIEIGRRISRSSIDIRWRRRPRSGLAVRDGASEDF
jgi:hypothetical protein